MAVNVRYDAERRYVSVELIGAVTCADIRSTIEEIADHAEIPKGAPALWDLRHSSNISMKFEILQNLLEFRRIFAEKRGHPKVAVLATSAVAYGTARMAETLNDLSPRRVADIRVFRDYEKALDWLTNESDSALQPAAAAQ